MAARLHRLRPRATRFRETQAEALRQHILAFDEVALPAEAVRQVIGAIDRATASSRGWTFVMLSPAQNLAVVRWLAQNSTRPRIAVQLWAELLTAIRIDTGEVLLSRDELATRLAVRPNAVSDMISELAGIGAVTRHRERVAGVRGPGRLVVQVNPLVATHLGGRARDRAQQAQRGPNPVGCTGGA